MGRKSESTMDGSWVVEEHSGDDSESGEDRWAESERQKVHESRVKRERDPEPTRIVRERRKSPRRATRTPPDQEFIMPTLSMPRLPVEKPIRKRNPAIPPPRTMPSQQFTTSSRPAQSNRQPHEPAATSPVVDKIVLVSMYAAEWLLEILGQTLKALKKPISWLLAAWLFAGMLMFLQNLLTSSIYAAVSPICRIPGVSFLNLPPCRYVSHSVDTPTISAGASAPVEFDALMKTQSQFEDILTESATGVSLPLDMKRSEASIRDLRGIVEYSKLPSRAEILWEFDGFVDGARTASYDLQRFNSHVGRGVDIVLSTARWTRRVLDDMAIKQSSRGAIPAFIQDRLLAPFKPVQFSEAMLLDQYIAHTRVVSDEIARLLDEAQALLLVLQNLEDRLDVIQSIAVRDNIIAQAGKDEILSRLWTSLGGYRKELGQFDKNLALLEQVGRYRKQAWQHVSAAILKLQAMGAELEELRTRVSSAEVMKARKDVHVPLAVHLDTLDQGVQRLEEARDRARRLENSHVGRVIDRSEQGKIMALADN